MTLDNVQIPEEYRDQLERSEPLDTRNNEQLISSLSSYQPQRVYGPSWTIRVLDTVPGSPNHALQYIPPKLLSETFVNSTMDGPYTGPHSADFLRGACLLLHGGVFMDVGIILTRSLDRICWAQLEDPCTPFNVSASWMYGTSMANHFLFLYVWKDRTNFQGLTQHPLFAFAAKMDFSASAKRGFKWEFIVDPATVFDYISQVLAWIRLTMLEDAGDGFSCADYAVNNILWFDVLPENWGFEEKVGFRGENLFKIMATRTDGDLESEEYKKAMQKITHGENLTKTPALGSLWDREENQGKDIEPGTFAELLRYGTTHLNRREVQFGSYCVSC
ncbi:glycosyltransferase [Aspergillus foveolatus]|uniref:glycosyltransferase n=1 Tax=Aspergillus foveolatus TaxID=210207 RepID=UPI003CCDD345